VKPSADYSEKALRAGWWILSAVAIALVFLIRIRFLNLPLERDEGEYAYTGQLMLQGIPPYKLAYNMKLPGTAAAYALLMSIFGQTIAGVHLGLMLINAATIVLIFLLGRRLLDTIAGLAAAGAYAVLSVMPYVLGTAAHATHFVVVAVLGAVLLLLRSEDRPSLAALFGSGGLFGIALLMKQPAIFFIPFAAAWLVMRGFRARHAWNSILMRTAVLVLGAIVPILVTCFFLWWTGVFEKFWFWTIDYAGQYGSQVSPSEGVQIFFNRLPNIVGPAWPLWIVAALGLLAFGLTKLRPAAGFAGAFLVFALLATAPGFYFRPHYFIVTLPAVALLGGAAVAGAMSQIRSGFRFVPLILFGIALGFPIVWERDFFFQRSLRDAGRMLYGTNPFPEAIRIAEYLRANTTENDTIAVLGSEPEIYFYSRRHSATGYIYTYGLMEPHKYARQMQSEMIQEIEQARPKYLVLVVVNGSWLVGRDSDKFIFTWANKYCDDYYEVVGLINLASEGSEFYFSEIPKSPTLAPDYIWIYKRKV
jgi:Dolichyl-phosphate-mannose-protein mannosyltransferase